MSNFIAFLERPVGNSWQAEFDDDYWIKTAWYNGRRVKLSERIEKILFNAYDNATDLEEQKRNWKNKHDY